MNNRLLACTVWSAGFNFILSCDARSPVVFCAFILVVNWPVAPSAADETPRQRFLRDAPGGWAALEQFAARSHSVVREETTIRPSDPRNAEIAQVMHRTIETKLAGPCSLVVTRIDPDWPGKVPTETVKGRNPIYGFRLVRDADDAPWIISRLQQMSLPTSPDPESGTIPQPMLGTGLYDISMRQVVGDPGFDLQEVRSLTPSDGERVEIEFRYQPAADNKSRLRGGRVVFLPDLHWALSEAEARIATVSGESLVRYAYDYTTDQSGFPLLRRLERTDDRDARHLQATVKEFLTYDAVELPEAEFKLTAFGCRNRISYPRRAPPGGGRCSWLVFSRYWWPFCSGVLRRRRRSADLTQCLYVSLRIYPTASMDH